MPAPVPRTSTVLTAHKDKKLSSSIADAFFGTFKGNDYPNLGIATGFSGEPHKGNLDAWSYNLDFSTKKALARQVTQRASTAARPRRGSAFPAAVPAEELLSEFVDEMDNSLTDADDMAHQLVNAWMGEGKNDYPALTTPAGYTGTPNRAPGQRVKW